MQNKLRTVRCILRRDDRFLMVVHHNRLFSRKERWALPGGRIEQGESVLETAMRELQEELSIAPSGLIEVGDYRYKGFHHKIFGTDFHEPVLRFDRSEIRRIGWHTLAQIETFEGQRQLHAGFEFDAIGDFMALDQA